MSPKVSVLMPSINGFDVIFDAIDWCSESEYRDFEIVILCNLKEEEQNKIIDSFIETNIRFLEPEKERSIAEARNRLLREAKGEFIAWLDDDDMMDFDRLASQLEYFEEHPETDILGSWMYGPDLEELMAPLTHEEIFSHLWYRNCMYQPSVMSRNFYVKENIFYDESYANSAEDYELWYRLRGIKKFANLDNFLVDYEFSYDTQLKKRDASDFKGNIKRLWERKWKDKNLMLSASDKELFIRFIYENFKLEYYESEQLKSILQQILSLRNAEPYDHFICSFLKLRIWRNSSWSWRLKNPAILFNLRKYKEYRRNGLLYR